MELSDELYDRIEELSETGNEAMESEDYAKAISCFQEALDILPEPKEDWEAYLWLVGSIGDAHFMMGNYGKSLEFFRKCYNIGETDNPFILLRLGENYLEMEDETNATEFLLRAYMLEGEKIFKEDWKYSMAVRACESQTKIITKLYGTHEKGNNRQNQATGRQRSKPEREFTERGSLCHYIRYGLVP